MKIEGELKIAGVGPRLGAKILDVIITNLALAGVSWMVKTSGWAESSFVGQMTGVGGLGIIGGAMFSLIIPHYVYENKATIGKNVAGIKMVTNKGAEVSFLRLLVRVVSGSALQFFILTLTVLMGTRMFYKGRMSGIGLAAAPLAVIISYLVPLIDKKHRAIHDWVAGTVVVEEKHETK
jgi:uncharacterized RDD family membrane protein YckC